jgi:TetR/AcrR family tetracycline transcriptional repressor
MAITSDRGVGRPARFTREQLIAVALERGPDNLNLSDIAKALDVPRTTVYNHVRNPDALGRLVLAALYDEHPWPTSPERPGTWQAELEAFADNLRDMTLAAGAWARFGNYEAHLSEAMLHQVDRLAGILVESGFPPELTGQILGLVSSLAIDAVAAVANEHRSPPEAERFVARLDAAAFPNLTTVGAAQMGNDADQLETQFRFNLRCAIAGIEAAVPRRRS